MQDGALTDSQWSETGLESTRAAVPDQVGEPRTARACDFLHHLPMLYEGNTNAAFPPPAKCEGSLIQLRALVEQVRLFACNHIPQWLILKPANVRSAHLLLSGQCALM
jgi:hypothetical protein